MEDIDEATTAASHVPVPESDLEEDTGFLPAGMAKAKAKAKAWNKGILDGGEASVEDGEDVREADVEDGAPPQKKQKKFTGI